METKKEKIVSAVATIGIVLTLFGATYAYFISRSDAGKTTDVEITANTVDVFSFETGDAITLSLDQDTFAEGTGDKSGTTYAKATLTPNNKTNTATDYYYLYLNITENTFSYSLGSDKPEVLLQVTDADGATVTSLDGLTYSTITNGAGESVSGFDITTKAGLITLANNKEITANTDTKEDTWNIKVIYVNYNENQADNAGNSFKAKLMIQEAKFTLANFVQLQYTGIQGENNLYYHNGTILDDDGNVIDAEDNSYRYAGGHDEVNNFICFGSDATICPDDNLYRIIGVFGDQVKLIKWDYANSDLLGTDGDYCSSTYTESDYSTYKGSKTTINRYFWDWSTKINTWRISTLNTINLNTNFVNNIGSTWSNKIAETPWIVGGNTDANIRKSNAKTAYTNEIINPNTDVENTYQDKVALMYTSDYYYGVSPTYWTYPGYSDSGDSYDYRAATGENWMYMGLHEWTVVRRSGSTVSAFSVDYPGYVNFSFVDASYYALSVRPVFYLNSDVTYVSGFGTKTDPIIID